MTETRRDENILIQGIYPQHLINNNIKGAKEMDINKDRKKKEKTTKRDHIIYVSQIPTQITQTYTHTNTNEPNKPSKRQKQIFRTSYKNTQS